MGTLFPRIFSFFFSDLSPNMSKCEIAGIARLKGVERTVWSMKNINFTKRVCQ